MSGWLPEIEGWVKVLGAFVAVVMAILVPVRSWLVEDRRDRDRMLSATRAIPAPDMVEPALRMLAAEIRGLAEALGDCAAILREADAGGEERGDRDDAPP